MGYVYHMVPDADGTRGILEPPGVSGIRLKAQTYLKKALCQTRPVGETYDQYNNMLTTDTLILLPTVAQRSESGRVWIISGNCYSV